MFNLFRIVYLYTNNLIKGKIGKDLDLSQGYAAAERCGLSLIAHARKACDGNLEKIKSCIKLTGYVNSTDSFIDQPKVINGFSDLMISVFGDKGKHARSAVGMASLPSNVAVEVEMIVEVYPD